MELPIPDGARLSGSDWGAGRCAERLVGLLGAAPTIPGVSWRFSGKRSKRRAATTRSPALWPACDCLRSQVTARFLTRHAFACGALRRSGLKALDHELDDGRPAGKVEVGAQRADVGKELTAAAAILILTF